MIAAHDQSDAVLASPAEANRPTITLELAELSDPAVGHGPMRRIDWPRRSSQEVAGSLLRIKTISLSPNGRRLATGDAQGAVRLWDAATLREVAVLGRHPGSVGGVLFLPDGCTLLSVDSNQTSIVGSTHNDHADLVDILQLVAARKVKPIIENYRMDDVNDVMVRLAQGKVRYRAVLAAA